MTEQVEAGVVIFTEYRKKIGDDEYAVDHLTLRQLVGETEEQLAKRYVWWETWESQKGFEHCDAPKTRTSYPYRGGGQHKEQKVVTPIKEEVDANGQPTSKGSFEVGSLAMFQYKQGETLKKNIRVYGVNGEECVAWEGKPLDAALKNMGEVAVQFTGWAGWKVDEQHMINWDNHKLIAHCKKSAVKTDESGKQTGGKWYVESFEVANKKM